MGRPGRINFNACFVALLLGPLALTSSAWSQENGAVIRAPAPRAAQPGVLRDFRPLRIGYQFTQSEYAEPGVMKEVGSLHGFSALYEGFLRGPRLLARLNGDLAFGAVAYEGGLSDPKTGDYEKYSTSGSDYVYNLKASFGIPVDFGNRMQVVHFFGYGYRYLNDQLIGEGSYEREISYQFLPIGLEFRFFFNRGWALAVGYEYDHLLLGRVKSHLTDVGYSGDLVNNQSEGSGSGHRISLEVVKAFAGGAEIHFVPYLQVWKIKDSDYQTMDGVSGWHEPTNETVHAGFTVAMGI